MLKPVDTPLGHFYYTNKKSSKKYRELKNLYKLMKGFFEMYSAEGCLVKNTRTWRIDHGISAMGFVIWKLDLHT